MSFIVTPEEIFHDLMAEYRDAAARVQETRPNDEPPAEADAVPYAYGPPATALRETNYVSDENLMLWLAEKQSGLYADLQDRMDLSGQRNKIMEDLSHIRERIEGGDISPEQAHAEMTAIIESYRGTPFESGLEELFRPMLDRIEEALSSSNGFEHLKDIFDGVDAVKALGDSIKSKVDALGHDDQLELVRIQSLSSDINQASQLASNLMASSNQAANAILGNIGR
jgi:hypothetical protein